MMLHVQSITIHENDVYKIKYYLFNIYIWGHSNFNSTIVVGL